MSRRILLRGAIHAHSLFSHDGVLPVAEVSTFFFDRSFDFVCITEHSQDMNQRSVEDLREQCRRYSTDRFILIPGLEFTCIQETHILGLGVTELTDTTDPSAVIDHIRDLGGVAILAHPDHRNYPLEPAWVRKLDGAEIWNVRSDGKYIPRPPAIRKFQHLREWHPDLLAFFGVDFHQSRGFYPMGVTLLVEELTEEKIITALRDGHYSCVSTALHFKPKADIHSDTLALLQGFSALIDVASAVRNALRPTATL